MALKMYTRLPEAPGLSPYLRIVYLKIDLVSYPVISKTLVGRRGLTHVERGSWRFPQPWLIG